MDTADAKSKRRAEAAKEREQRQKRRAEAAEEREKRQKIATQNTAGPAGSPSRTKTQEPPPSPPDKSTDPKEYLDFDDDDDVEKLKQRYADLEKEDLRLHADQISQDQKRYAEIVRDRVALVYPGVEAGVTELYSGKFEHMKQKERGDFEEVFKMLRDDLKVIVSIFKPSE